MDPVARDAVVPGDTTYGPVGHSHYGLEVAGGDVVAEVVAGAAVPGRPEWGDDVRRAQQWKHHRIDERGCALGLGREGGRGGSGRRRGGGGRRQAGGAVGNRG